MADSAIIKSVQDQADDKAASAAGSAGAPRKWRCLNCGQLVFTAAFDAPSDVCQCCKDMTTWQALQR